MAWFVPSQKWQPDMTHLLYGAILGTASLGVAWLMSIVNENKTYILKSYINQMFPQADAAVPVGRYGQC